MCNMSCQFYCPSLSGRRKISLLCIFYRTVKIAGIEKSVLIENLLNNHNTKPPNYQFRTSKYIQERITKLVQSRRRKCQEGGKFKSII